jgi:ribosomal protein S18 acetylase RimI-like enzyme
VSKDDRDQQVRHLLEEDRIWCAYALADLDPAHTQWCTWFVNDHGVVLVYQGFHPPILFAHGSRADVASLLTEIKPGIYQFTLRAAERMSLQNRLHAERENLMWRMVLDPSQFNPPELEKIQLLTIDDLDTIQDLFADSPEGPDAFQARQLTMGPFFGSFQGKAILSIAGVHVVSKTVSVAALGNVYTHPEYRNRGLATQTSAAVVKSLLEDGISTIVLNVALDNAPAVHLYQQLGFQPYCTYHEGVGRLGQSTI